MVTNLPTDCLTGTVAGSSTISQFCARHRFGRTTYFKMRSSGCGPRELRQGRVVRITTAAELEWLERMQARSERHDNR